MELLLTTLSMRRLFYLIFLISLSFIFYQWSTDTDRYWLIWIAFFVSLAMHESFDELSFMLKGKALFLLFVVLLFIIVSCAFLSFVPVLLAIGLGLLTCFCVYFAANKSHHSLLYLIMNMLGMIAGLLMLSVHALVHIIYFVSIGFVIFSCCHLLFYSKLAKNEARVRTYLTLRQLRLLSQEIFLSIMNPLYKDNIYLFERRIHVKKNKFIESLYLLKKSLVREKKSMQGWNKLNLLYDVLLQSGALRFRVKDHAIFKVCEDELAGVMAGIDRTVISFMGFFSYPLKKARFSYLENIKELHFQIQRLDENYQHFLQVAAENPLVFFLFISHLQSFVDELQSFHALLLTFNQ